MTAGLFFFAVQDVIIKRLSGDYAVLQILTIRIAVVLVIFLLLCRLRYGWGILATRHTPILMVRGVLAFLAFTAYYLALAKIPMGEASVVYMTAPLFVTMLSVPLLGEVVGFHRWAAVLVGFFAVLLVVNPGSSVFRVEAALPLFSALCYALLPIITRKIGLSAPAVTIATYNSLSYLVCCLVLSAVVLRYPATELSPVLWQSIAGGWVMPDWSALGLILLSGCIFAVAVLCITQAYRIASVSAVAPFEYTYLLWSVLMGYLAFGDVPGSRTLFGAVVIVSCGLYVLYREKAASSKLK